MRCKDMPKVQRMVSVIICMKCEEHGGAMKKVAENRYVHVKCPEGAMLRKMSREAKKIRPEVTPDERENREQEQPSL